MERRKFLLFALGSIPSILASTAMAKRLAASCGVTPRQTEGPFYPLPSQWDQEKDSDLTYTQDKSARALGQEVILQGQIMSKKCVALAGAVVEIWQACASGRYNHPSDPNRAELDPNFQYWGRAISDENGRFAFKTIKPGAYPAGNNWIRPPHIHVKVSKLGFMELISQIYFARESLNEQDLILKRIPAREQDKVVVDFNPNPQGILEGSIQINLEPV